jgi:hypothetical protein
MNHRPLGSLLLSKAIVGFINYKTAEGLSCMVQKFYPQAETGAGGCLK